MDKPKKMRPSALGIMTALLRSNWLGGLKTTQNPREMARLRNMYKTRRVSHYIEPNCARHLRHRVKHNGTAFVYPQTAKRGN